MSFGWATRIRLAVATLVTFGLGVVAATAGVFWAVRLVAAVGFVVGTGLVLDAVVLARSWRMTDSALKVPSLLSRKREIVGREDLVVERTDRAVLVRGPNGVGRVSANPLVSAGDLRRWFEQLPDH